MIIRVERNALLLIRQPDHASVSAVLMDGWTGLAANPHRDSVRLAIAEHDNGWREPDSAPVVAADGRLLDFVHAPDDVRRGIWPRGVERLAATPYAAALVAQHSLVIFDRYRAKSDWQPFFDEMTRRRNAHLAHSGRTETELLGDYALVRIGDLLSLVFCNAWTDEHTAGGYRIRLCDRSTLVVTPDPFGGRDVSFAVEARRLPIRRFASPEDARGAYDAAPREALHGRAVGA